MAAGGHFENFKNGHISATRNLMRFMYVTHHNFPSDTIKTVDTYDRRLDTSFAREAIYEKKE